ncbi:MAG: IS21-like element helper ATPase IstB, partial [Paracoccaceae bacterium]
MRLPGIKRIRSRFAERADKEGWPAARHLAALAERELAERERRRIERHLAAARLPPGKTLDGFDFDAVPVLSKAQVMALVAGDGWLEKGDDLLVSGPPGGGKSHLAAAIGLGLVENGWRVPFARTTDLVQRLQVARRELALEAAIAKLDKYHLPILDDLAYVTKDQAETGVPFELISARYERRSVLITANQPFGEGNRIFPDPAMTLAAVDRLVHHATILELNVESCRRRAAVERRKRPGRPPTRATVKATADRRSATIRMRKPLLAAADAAIIPPVAALRLSSRSSRSNHPDCRATPTLASVGRVLSETWTSLPSGIEEGQDEDAFVRTMNRHLTGEADPSAALSASARMSSATTEAVRAPTPTPST